MNVGDLYRRLSYGELSNLSLGMDGAGTIKEAGKPKVILHANAGLLQLYGQFPLCEKELLVEMVEGVSLYHLDPRFSYSRFEPNTNQAVTTPYIQDLGGEPFAGDVIRVLEVWDSSGTALPLNDAEAPFSVFTPQPAQLQVPRVRPFAALGVRYQARHPQLWPELVDQEIVLPDVLHEALTAYIAWKIYTNMNVEGAGLKAREHLARFETLCAGAVSQDLVSTSPSTTNSRFAKRGWI